MKVIKPKPLKYGSTLGIIATGNPISTCSDSVIDRCYEFLKSKGFNIIEANCCRMNVGHTAGSISDRVNDFHSLIANPEIY